MCVRVIDETARIFAKGIQFCTKYSIFDAINLIYESKVLLIT